MARKPFTAQIRYWTVKREAVPFGDALTAPRYGLDTFQSEHWVRYTTRTGYNRHVLATLRDIVEDRDHKILAVQTMVNGGKLHVYRDAYGLLGVYIPPINVALIETAAR